MPNCVQFLSVPSSFVSRWKYNKLHVDFLIDRFTTHQKILFTFRFYFYFISFSTSHKLNSNIILYTYRFKEVQYKFSFHNNNSSIFDKLQAIFHLCCLSLLFLPYQHQLWHKIDDVTILHNGNSKFLHVLFSAFETKIAIHPAKNINIKGNRDVQYLFQIQYIFETSNAFFSFAFKTFKNDSCSCCII